MDIHTRRWGDIKQYVDFKINLKKLTAYDKRKIKKYHDIIAQLKSGSKTPYSPRGITNRKIAQKAAHGFYLKGLKTAFIPHAMGEQIKPSIKNGKLHVANKYYDLDIIYISEKQILKRRGLAIVDAMEKSPNRIYNIIAGDHLIPTDLIKPSLAEEYFEKLINRYGNPNEQNYFGNWLFGIRAFKFKNQELKEEYNETFTSEEYKAKRKKTKRKQTRREKILGRK